MSTARALPVPPVGYGLYVYTSFLHAPCQGKPVPQGRTTWNLASKSLVIPSTLFHPQREGLHFLS